MLDPFATAEDVAGAGIANRRQQIITAGRYRLPNRDGSDHKGGWQRVTTLVKAITDQFSLRIWEIEQVMVALHIDPDGVSRDLRSTLVALQGQDYGTRRGEIEAFTDRCKAIAGGSAGSKFGNARHELVEADHLKLPLPAADAFAREHLSLFKLSLDRNDLDRVPEMAERRVMVERFNAVGTLDAILCDRRTGFYHVGDLKTQKKFWTWLEIAAQMACYAHADAMWVPTDPQDQRAGHWIDMPPVSRSVAMVPWMPREHPSGQPEVDVYEVDIEAGWKTAQLCYEVIQDRRGGKSAKEPRAWLRKAAPMTDMQRYAALFSTVQTREEGSRLVEECKRRGIWNVVMIEEAQMALKRIEEDSKKLVS